MERKETDVVREGSAGTVREESRVTTTGAGMPVADDREVVSSVAPAKRAFDVIYLVFGVIDGLLLIRLLLKLLGASPDAGFSNFIYGMTNFLLAPFKGLLPAIASGKSIFEPSLVIAMLVYALLAFLLAKVVAITLSRSVTVSQRRSSSNYRPGAD